MGYLRIFLRAFLIVFLTAANVRLISGGRVVPMFLTGCGISLCWWYNARVAAHSPLPFAGWVYALGAGTGTVAGWWGAGLV